MPLYFPFSSKSFPSPHLEPASDPVTFFSQDNHTATIQYNTTSLLTHHSDSAVPTKSPERLPPWQQQWGGWRLHTSLSPVCREGCPGQAHLLPVGPACSWAGQTGSSGGRRRGEPHQRTCWPRAEGLAVEDPG